MHRSTMALALVATLCMVGFAPAAVDVIWDGGDGYWNGELNGESGNWNGGQTATAVLGVNYGSNGSADINGGSNIIIGGGAVVTYDANATLSDFRVKQGSSLTIQDGAVWQQVTDILTGYEENMWVEMDQSNLNLDGGIFRRTGSYPGEGPGALLFGSWRGDDNFNRPGTPRPQVTNINITNGGGLENEGQLWFGSWEDGSPGLIVTMTINDGYLDLTGGDFPGVGDEADADLVFTKKWLPNEGVGDVNLDDEVNGLDVAPFVAAVVGGTYQFEADANYDKVVNGLDVAPFVGLVIAGGTGDYEPQYTINFTGPGSITVDSSGIIFTEKLVDGAWTNLDPITYEELWDMGVLQANGLSGLDEATFGDYFTTSGSLGSDNYTLTSLVGGGAAAVPEPSTMILAGLGLLGVVLCSRRKR